MLPRQILCWALTTWLSVQAITIPIDRADIKSESTRSSMIANGWRPLTGYESIGTNGGTSQSSHNERLTHPVLGKYQEHMASSEKSRIQYKTNQQHEYSPPSILGSFSVFGHAATKARIKHKDHQNKQIIPSETREYTFLLPPPRDVFRFDVEPHRKGILRDNDAFLRQPSFISAGPQADIRNTPFFIKPTGFSSTTHSPGFSKLRPFGGFGVQQTLQPPRHSAQAFEPQKVTSDTNKVFLQPPSVEVPVSFNAKHKLSENSFKIFQQTHTPQILNGDAGNFYSQVDHPAPYKTSYERDPAFLVHESHEVSYVTPSSTFGFNFRPSLPYDNIFPSNNFDTSSTSSVASTTTPSSTSGKFLPSQAPNTIQPGIEAGTATSGLSSAYYVSEHQDLTPPPSPWPIQKSKFTTEINEVLPKKNSPTKFRQEPLITHSTPQQQRHQQQQQHHHHHQQQQQQQQQQQHHHQQQQQQQHHHHQQEQQHQQQQQRYQQQQRVPEIVFLRPDLQQQYQSTGIPVTTVQQQTVDPQYETPESISLKHFNEQQFLIQQQLIQRDRQRLQEQELQRQRKIQQQQEDELKKRQEELRILEDQQKQIHSKKIEAERQEHAQEQLQNQQNLEDRKRFEEQQRLIAQQKQGQRQDELSQLVTEENMQHHDNEKISESINYQQQQKQQQQQLQLQQQQLQKPESSNSNGGSEYKQTQENYEPEMITREPELKIRTHRPVKQQRGQYRRRRPTTPIYEVQVTEASPQLETTFDSLPEIPVQTTIQPDSLTTSVTVRPRIRRPLNGGVRRRLRPTTTPLPEVDTTASAIEDDYLKYDHASQVDLAKRRRPIRPTQPTLVEEVVTERRPAIRKRPGHRIRVHPGEPFEAEVVTEIVKPTKTTYKETTEWENYPASFEKSPASPAEEFFTQVYTISSQETEESSTESVLPEYQTEIAFPEEHYIRTHASRERPEKLQNIPLEELFDKPEKNHVNLPTTADSYTTIASTLPVSTTTTPSTIAIITTESQMVTTNGMSSTTRASHRIRPLRFGNATRPRFSVKDYKSRLDYKNRLGQLSTTEATPHSVTQTRQRSSTPKPQEISESPNRETTGRYKYMSRASYRTTSTTKPTRETFENEQNISTTERINRFTPKRRLNQNGHLYRSRIASSSSKGNENKQDGQNEFSVKYSTARPENVFSSAIRRRPDAFKNRIQNTNEDIQVKKEDATEMIAEETSFYSIATTVPTTIESVNEVVSKDDSVATSEKIIENIESVTEIVKNPLILSANGVETVEMPYVIKMDNDNVMSDVVGVRPSDPASTESTFTIETSTIVDLQSEEELFAKASQSVADLTSSASALYDKPGLFKAVSPATESRVVNPNFKISTDEPTLPIEAFFQDLSSKE